MNRTRMKEEEGSKKTEEETQKENRGLIKDWREIEH